MKPLFAGLMVLLCFAGTVLAVPLTLTDGENWMWDMASGGHIIDGGLDSSFDFDTVWDDTFDDHHYFEVNSSDYTATSNATESNGREVIFDTQSFGDIDAWRKIYVPSDYGFARFLQCVTNTGTSSSAVTVRIHGELGNAGQPIGSDGAFSNNNDLDSEDRWVLWGSENCDGESMVLFDGVGGTVSATTFYEQSDDCPDFEWQFTLQPGETKYLVYFAAQRVGFTDLRKIITFLIDHPEIAFADMTTAELEGVCNWVAGDADADGLVDSWESMHGVNSPTADDDNDGLTNQQEYDLGTDPGASDTDNDGVKDGTEVDDECDPLDSDSDDDGLLDGAEKDIGTNPKNNDTDGDLIPDGTERELGSDPLTFTDYGPNGLDQWDVFCGVNGDDTTGDGTQSNPYFSVSRALQDHPDNLATKSLHVGSATTFDIFVGPGWYNMTFSNTWSDLTDMKIEGAGRGICTLDGMEQTYNSFQFWGDCTDIEISGFSFFGVNNCVDATNNFDGLYVHDLEFILHDDGIELNSDIIDGEYTISNCEFRLGDQNDIYYENTFLGVDVPPGEVLNINNVALYGNADDSMIELLGYDTSSGTVNIDNAIMEHGHYHFEIYDWGTVNIRDSRVENCSHAAYFGNLDNLSIENSIFSGMYDDDCVTVDNDISVTLTLRNNTFVSPDSITGFSAGSCFLIDDVNTPTVQENIVIHNNVFAFAQDFGIEWDDFTMSLGSSEDYNAFFGNTNGDIYDGAIEKSLNAPISANSISDTDGDFVEDDIMADLIGEGVYTPQAGSFFLGRGDNLDGVADTLDNDIGADNSNFAVASASIEPGTDTISVLDADPSSDSFGAGAIIDQNDVVTGGTVTVTSVDETEVTTNFAACGLSDNEDRIFDINSTVTFLPGAVVIIQLPYRARGRGRTPRPRIMHQVQDPVTGDCSWVELENVTFDPITGLVTGEHDPANGFSPFAVAGNSLIYSNGGGGGAMDWSMMLGLLLLAGLLVVRRRM